MSAEPCVKEESEYVATEHGLYHVVVKKEFTEENGEADEKFCWDSAGALAGLYWDHVVKEELVLGPERPHRPDHALVVRDWALGDADGCPQAPGARGGAQLALRECSVRLERLPRLDAVHTELRTAPHETNNEFAFKGEPHINDQIGPCIMCEKKFALKSIHIHMPQESDMEEEKSNVEVGRQREPYACDICRESFISKSDLMKHAMSHIHVKIEREENGDEALYFDFPSQDCSVFANESSKTSVVNLERDIERMDSRHTTENTYICDYCGRTFKQKPSLMCHIKVHFENPQKTNNVIRGSRTRKKHSCEQCGKKIKYLSILKTHRSVHTGERPYSCEVCNKKFARLDGLAQHKPIHMSQKPYTCEICKRAFAQRSSLLRHGSIHEVKGKKTYSCKLCNKEYSDRCALNGHKRIHTGEKHYSCEICLKTFTYSGELNVHRRKHTGEKPYSCELCQKTFTQLGDLNAHKRIHTGEKPYRCDKCNKCFRKQTDLSRHTNTIHTRHKPHCCEICGEKFFRLYRLTEHRRKHTREKPLKCEICLKCFSYYDGWRAHLKVHMSKKKSYKQTPLL